MKKLKKIGEIRSLGENIILDVLKTLENQGFLIVDECETDTNYKTYYILKEE
jgi:hypothetical protein